jgi:hypothetical protein
MHVWLDLIIRELLFLALVTAFGSGPATFLPERFDGVGRFAMAPVLGLCIGVCGAVTLIYFFPAHSTSWVVIPVALASLAVAAWRWKRLPTPRWPSRRGAIQIAVVAVVILVSFDYPLAHRGTVGPAGGYAIADTTGYVSETNGEARQSIRQTRHDPSPFADLSLYAWASYAYGYQQLDLSAFEANVNQLVGLGATDTDSAFLIAVILIGALGVFAVVRGVSGVPTWGAVLGACLLGGPLFVELFMDGSQAALAGCALLAPTVMLGCEALWCRRFSTLALLALLLAGLQTVYPLFLPAIVIAACAAIAVLGIRRLMRGMPSWDEWLLAIGQIALVAVLAAVFTPEAFSRNVRYWESLLNGSLSLVGLPAYDLPANVLPGWVLQTREFYGLVDLSHASAGKLFMGALVPLFLIGVILLAVKRSRDAKIMLVVAAAASLLAYYTWASRSCGYCVQRNMIPVAALAAPALGLGVAALATLRWRGRLLLAAGVSAVIVVTIGHEGVLERQRLANGSYLLNTQNRQALASLPHGAGPVDVEGFSQGPQPPMELPLVYNLVDEKTHGKLSLPTDRDDNSGLAYLGGTQPLGPAFRPNYTYVLTRMAGIATDRRIVARYGPIALEQRTQPLDVTINGGVSVAAVGEDSTGTAWLNPGRPLHFVVSGGSPGTRAWVSLVLRTTVPVRLVKQAGVSAVIRPGITRICALAAGAPPVRVVGFEVAFVPTPAPVPKRRFANPLPPRGAKLVSMTVSATPCTAGS